MRKLLALALALTLGVSMVVPASAAASTIESLIVKSNLDYDYLRIVEEGFILTQTDLDGDGRMETPGLLDSSGNEIKIPSGYELVTDGLVVSEGMLLIRQAVSGGTDTQAYQYGFMNTSGAVVVPPKYDFARAFSEGLAEVGFTSPGDVIELAPGITVTETITQLGFIDKTGALVIPAVYERSSSSTTVWNDAGTGYQKSGFSEGLISVQKGGKWGVINQQGSTVLPFQYDSPVGSFHNGLASFSSRGKSGFLNQSGTVVIAPAYDDVQDFVNGYAIVANRTNQYDDMLYGAIDTQGTLVVPIKYPYMKDFHEGMACVSDSSYGGGKYGFVNTSGTLVVPMQYAQAHAFSDGLAVVALEDERFHAPTIQYRYGYINAQGKAVIPIQYSLASSVAGGIAVASLNVADHIGNNTSAHFDGAPEYIYFDTNGTKLFSHGGKPYQEISFSNKSGILPQADGRYAIVKNPCYGGAPTPAIVGNFTDVSATAYYADSVAWAVDHKITSGTSATTFSPNETCTTAQILTFLWKANGAPEPTIQNPFADVADGAYYANAALWAAEHGLISGTTFGADVPCTRGMTVTYLWKLAGSPSVEGTRFTDVPHSADYAQAVAWAVDKEITSGMGQNTFSPNTTCTRGQIVTFLYRAG